jgi:excinuclease ABC subunit A
MDMPKSRCSLPDVYVECSECHGRRYNSEALEIHWRGKHIADILDMTVEEARRFFVDQPPIYEKLSVLHEVGLGYVKLGQPATTLSGGEAQRVKLATELSRRATGRTLYILDEPTTGLHFDDIYRLLGVLNALVDKGNTVLVIEHNLDVIKCADWVVVWVRRGLKVVIVAEGGPEGHKT